MFQLTNEDAGLYLSMVEEMADVFLLLKEPEEDIEIDADSLKNLLYVNNICKEITGEKIFSVKNNELNILEVEDEHARQLFLHGYIPFNFVQDFEPVKFAGAVKHAGKIWINIEEGLCF